jgi:hypothetical protein
MLNKPRAAAFSTAHRTIAYGGVSSQWYTGPLNRPHLTYLGQIHWKAALKFQVLHVLEHGVVLLSSK